VGRALDRLGIEHIPAYSPEARGRSERMFGTLQGPVYAKKLVRAFGEKVFDVIEATPDRLPGRTRTRIREKLRSRIEQASAPRRIVGPLDQAIPLALLRLNALLRAIPFTSDVARDRGNDQ
jgi:hypothetical protein